VANCWWTVFTWEAIVVDLIPQFGGEKGKDTRWVEADRRYGSDLSEVMPCSGGWCCGGG